MRMVGTARRCSATCGRTGTRATAFGAGTAASGDQYLFPPSDRATTTARRHVASPASRAGSTTSGSHDEARYLFNYTGAFSLEFYGDDDLFIFINGKLVSTSAASTSACRAASQVDADGMATIIEGGSLDAAGHDHPA